MRPAEFLAARERLGLSDDALAPELGVPPRVVRAWAAGAVAVPRRYARTLAWRAALAEQDAALAASGLPACEWAASWQAAPLPFGTKRQLAHFESLERHVRACPTCTAREQHARERLPPLPEPPLIGVAAVLEWLLRPR